MYEYVCAGKKKTTNKLKAVSTVYKKVSVVEKNKADNRQIFRKGK